MHKVGHRDGDDDDDGGGDSRRLRPLDTLRCRGQAPLTRQSRRGEWGRSIEERTPRDPREELLASCALLVNALQASVIHTTHTSVRKNDEADKSETESAYLSNSRSDRLGLWEHYFQRNDQVTLASRVTKKRHTLARDCNR